MKQDTLARNREICAERASGKTLQEIADKHGITRERVRQIAARTNGDPQTLAQLPGSEGLTAATRGLLIRLGYRSTGEILKAIKERRLREHCAFGMGATRFAEIVMWASTFNE